MMGDIWNPAGSGNTRAVSFFCSHPLFLFQLKLCCGSPIIEISQRVENSCIYIDLHLTVTPTISVSYLTFPIFSEVHLFLHLPLSNFNFARSGPDFCLYRTIVCKPYITDGLITVSGILNPILSFTRTFSPVFRCSP